MRYDKVSGGCHLEIERVMLSDGATYTCTVYTGGGRGQVTGETQGRHRGQGGYSTLVYTGCVGAGAGILVASRVELEVLVGVSQPQILQHNPIVMVEGDKVGWQNYFYIINNNRYIS